MSGVDGVPTDAARGAWRHWLAFGLCGLLATATDVGVFVALHDGAGAGPLVARLVAIGTAVVVGWAAHRRFTFRMTTPPRPVELLRYVGVAWVAILVNYGVFASLVHLVPTLVPALVIVFSSAVAMVVSYLGMRFGVFRRSGVEATGR